LFFFVQKSQFHQLLLLVELTHSAVLAAFFHYINTLKLPFNMEKEEEAESQNGSNGADRYRSSETVTRSPFLVLLPACSSKVRKKKDANCNFTTSKVPRSLPGAHKSGLPNFCRFLPINLQNTLSQKSSLVIVEHEMRVTLNQWDVTLIRP
jgi:hypothetical protein